MNKKYIFRYTIFSLNGIGVISQIAVIFTRRGINIENMAVSNTSAIGELVKFSITISTTSERHSITCYNLIKKIIGVREVFLHSEETVIKRELGVFRFLKKDLENKKNKAFVDSHNMTKLYENKTIVIYEKTEVPAKLKEIYKAAKEQGLENFASSGAVVMNQFELDEKTKYFINHLNKKNKNGNH